MRLLGRKRVECLVPANLNLFPVPCRTLHFRAVRRFAYTLRRGAGLAIAASLHGKTNFQLHHLQLEITATRPKRRSGMISNRPSLPNFSTYAGPVAKPPISNRQFLDHLARLETPRIYRKTKGEREF
jgi:hypothetical protein